MRLAGRAKGGYYPTPDRVVDMIASYIWKPYSYRPHDFRLRILDPCCGYGNAGARLADLLEERQEGISETFGVELNRERGEDAKKRLNHVLVSDIFQVAIENDAFGILYLNPPYDFDEDDRGVEQSFLAQTTRYLHPGGLLVFIIPRRALRHSARYLSTHYGQISIHSFPEPEREAFDQIVLFANRRESPQPDKEIEKLLIDRSHTEQVNRPLQFSDRVTQYGHTQPDPEPVYFTTRTIDPVIAASEARTNGLWASTEIMDTLWPHVDTRTKPLMPLRKGHLAMLIAAGFLDNLVLEHEEQRILVKGRTAKETKTTFTKTQEIHREHLRTTIVTLDLNSGDIEEIAA